MRLTWHAFQSKKICLIETDLVLAPRRAARRFKTVRPQSLKPGPCGPRCNRAGRIYRMGNGTQPSKLKNQVRDNCPEAQCSEVQCRRFGLGVIPTPRLPDDAHSARPCVK